MKLGIDVDDVLASFIPAFHAHARKLYPTVVAINDLPVDWSWSNWGLEAHEIAKVWEEIGKVRNFHMSLPPCGFTTMLPMLHLNKHDVYYITARANTDGISAKHQTELWLYSNFRIDMPTVLVTKEKVPVVNALGIERFIDDNASTCEAVAKYTDAKVSLLSRSHNQHCTSVPRVETFDEWAREVLRG